jgi:hypothetical protein
MKGVARLKKAGSLIMRVKTFSARMIQNLSAFVQRAMDPGNREQPRLRQIFLLHIHEQDDRNARRIRESPEACD